MVRKSGLGKGLEALFQDNETELGDRLRTLRLSEIEPNRDQPRRKMDGDGLADLAASIAEHGVLQPVVVRRQRDGGYQIVAGERRWRAARMAGLSEIPALVMDADDEKAMILALIENLQREDLNPMEEACGIGKLMTEAGLTQEEAAKRLGKSRPVVANALRLLTLPESVQERLRAGSLSAGHARALCALEGDAAEALAEEAVRKRLSVRELERRVRKLRKDTGPKPGGPGAEDPQPFRDRLAAELALSISESTGRRVRIERSGSGGRLIVEFFDDEDLRKLAKKLF